ncbi:organic cation transporter protein-like [Diaphorina citri]|uniref:Organic cation transporter protein-like n=1 Tax=Diaphorina citri TaxID=121845 RepID=A0A1S3D1J6_DIACI|nr:organic cation transporter protein-like [Diaphorina citri]
MFDRCQEYIPANNSWPLEKDPLVPDPSWNVTSCRNGWHYEMEDIPYASLAVEDNWVCDGSSNLAITRSIFFLGSLLGGFILSWVADRYGRITAVLGSHVVSFLGVALTPFSKDVVLFSLSRFLTGVGHFNAFIFYYIIVLECVGPKWRTFAMTFPFLIFYTVSEVALPWIAYYLADWQWISVITIFPLIVGLIVAIFTPESARWQMATGKVDKAVVTLNKIEKINRSHVDPKLYVQLKESYYRQHPPQRGDSSFKLVFHILKTENLRRNVFGCAVVWASLWFVYHGLMRNPRYFGFGPFTTASLLALTMFPACLLIILTSDVFGRKWLTIASLFFSALTLLLSTIDPGLLSSILAVIGRFLMNFGHIITLQYSAEIIPTVVRGQGLNLIHVLGCIASIVANFVVQMDPQESLLPAIIPGVIGVFGALVCILLPETLGKPLPETLEEGGNMKEDNLFDVICCDTQDDYD